VKRELGWRQLRAVSFVALTSVCGACSFPTAFFLINGSAAPTIVTVAADPFPHAETGEPVCLLGRLAWPAKVVRAELIGRNTIPEEEWSEAPDAVFSAADCTVRLTLPPGMAYLAWSSVSNDRRLFLEKVVFADQSGQTILEGPALARAFRKRSQTVYAVEHRRLPAAEMLPNRPLQPTSGGQVDVE
jgi:hypothetical protein